MIKLQLNRSGGQLGKVLRAAGHANLDESEVIQLLQMLRPPADPMSRDSFHYSITVNNNQTFPIDISRLTGDLKQVISDLENQLQNA